MTFRVGQQVECIDIKLSKCLRKQVYTCLGVDSKFLRVACCTDHNPKIDGWFTYRFRPIVEPRTEVSFTTGADPSSDQFDNRRKVRKKVAI